MLNIITCFTLSAPPSFPIIVPEGSSEGMPPLGLCYIGTVLNQAGYSVSIIDMYRKDVTMNDVMANVASSKPKIVGISCSTDTFNNAVRISKTLKNENPNCIIVFGGPHVSFEYESALNTCVVDFVVLNEGEYSFKKLCDYCLRGEGKLESLRGIAYRNGNQVILTEPEPYIENLDELPIPDRLLFASLSDYKHPATISTSRGCPGRCVFCAASVLSGGKYRMRSAKSIVSEFEYLKSLGFNTVAIVDDTMTANISRLNEFVNLMIERNVGMQWYCESRVDSMSLELLTKMKSAGLISIQYGIESGNQKILDSIKKGITLDQALNTVQWSIDLGVAVSTNLIIGQPDDDRDSIKDTLELGKRLDAMGVNMSFTVCTPFPGTELWSSPEKYGIEIVDFDLDYYNTYCPVINTKHMTSDEIRNAFYEVVLSFNNVRTTRIP